ncbi:MAG: helix-turn-helix domain-containing protein [Nocardioides sp.]
MPKNRVAARVEKALGQTVGQTVGHTVGQTVGQFEKTVETLGDYLKAQRVEARLSLRQLADQAGVSNPYLSQIEHGLRRPSAEVLQQLAKALRISAEQLYIRAGIVSPESEGASTVELAVLGDPALTERQKQSLLDVYASFLALNRAQLDQVSADQTSADQPATHQ